MRKLLTTKLFYNKWCYKICLADKEIKKIGTNLRFGQVVIYYGEKNTLNTLLSKYYFRDDTQFRFESNWCQIYLNDINLFDEIVNALNSWIVEIHTPESDTIKEFLFDNKRKVICSKLPRGDFNYKITLKNNNKWSNDDKKNFKKWLLTTFKEKVHISKNTEHWLEGGYRYVQEPFFYVKDSASYSMIGLYISDKIKKVEQYILRDKVLNLA